MDAEFFNDIKFNCDVSDAKYWGFYSICGLLMRYRDLYRSEQGLKPWAEISRTDIAAWIEKKETRWPEIENNDFRDLTIQDHTYHPFDVSAINSALRDQGLVYGAGYGMYMKPTFFLAKLRSVREVSGLTVYTSGQEFVRDLFTSPGMLQQKIIFLRLEPLTIFLLYKHAELNTRHAPALQDAFAQYGFPHQQIIDVTFEQRMEDLSLRFSEILLAHELAEAVEDVPEWKELLLLAEGDRQAEHYLRAVKDLIADTSDQGPYQKVITAQDRAGLSLSIALAEGFRRVLFPELFDAYKRFLITSDWDEMNEARKKGYARLITMRNKIAALFKEGAYDFIPKLKKQIQSAGMK